MDLKELLKNHNCSGRRVQSDKPPAAKKMAASAPSKVAQHSARNTGAEKFSTPKYNTETPSNPVIMPHHFWCHSDDTQNIQLTSEKSKPAILTNSVNQKEQGTKRKIAETSFTEENNARGHKSAPAGNEDEPRESYRRESFRPRHIREDKPQSTRARVKNFKVVQQK
jgi:hypothetical protein